LCRITIFLLFILFLPGSFVFSKNTGKICGPSQDSFLMYKVHDEDSSVFLMGSIHMGQPDFYPLPEHIEQAFQNSSYLAVELDPSSRENTAAMLEYQNAALLPEGQTLDQILTPETYSRVISVMNQLNMPLNQIKRFRPWSLSVLIPLLQLKVMGFSEEYGVDLHFLNKAKEQRKPILELESVEEQMDLLLEMDTEDYLVYTLDSTESDEDYFDLVRAWRQGNVHELEAVIFEDPGPSGADFSEIEEKMFTVRNQKMTDRIVDFLKDDEDYFVVVGSGHLIGEEGIVSLLSRLELPVMQDKAGY
jgi:uncharacterized protein